MEKVRLEPIQRQTLTVQEIATYLGVSPETIYGMTREKAIPHFRIGSRILFKLEAINQWIDGQINGSVENE